MEGSVAGSRRFAEVRQGLRMSLEEAMLTQRAVRRVLPDPVDDDIVLRCIELALKAPTASNGQNWEFVVVKDAAVKAALAEQYRRAWVPYREARGAEPVDDSMEKVLRSVQWQVDHFEEIPVLVVAGLDEGPGASGPRTPVAETSHYGAIYPSVQNLLLAARAMGLGASLITLPLWSMSRARRILDLPDHVHPVCIVAMGWPRGRYGPTKRRPVGEVVHLDHFGKRPWLEPDAAQRSGAER